MNQQLVDYIKQQLGQMVSKDVIRNALLANGWQAQDIEGGFNAVNSVPGAVSSVPVAPIEYAGFWVRWVANLIDGIILMAIGLIIGIILVTLLGFSAFIAGLGESIVPNFIRLFGLIAGWFYFIFMTYKYEATFGKKIAGVKVISDKNDNLTLGQVILRETLGKIASVLTLYIGYIMVGFTKRKQGLHDKIASTTVVYKDPTKKSNIIWVIIGFVFVFIISVGILSSIVLASLNSARQKSRDAKRISDLKQLQLGLELQYDYSGSYPRSLSEIDPQFIQAISVDPATNMPYQYKIQQDGINYEICAQLENNSIGQKCFSSEVSGGGSASTLMSNDGKRKADLTQIFTSLEWQYNKSGKYPSTLSEISPQFLYPVPVDPATNMPYQYKPQPDGRSYELCAQLDDKSNGGEECIKVD